MCHVSYKLIEDVWWVLKQRIYQSKIPYPRRIGKLPEAIRKHWSEVTNEELISLIESILWRK
jgi:hypothetical protein